MHNLKAIWVAVLALFIVANASRHRFCNCMLFEQLCLPALFVVSICLLLTFMWGNHVFLSFPDHCRSATFV